MNAAQALQARQRHYDRLHHLARLVWMEDEAATWGDGTPVTKVERQFITEGSHYCLTYITQHGMSTNSVDLADNDYLAQLDQFATTHPDLTGGSHEHQ